MNQKKHDGLDKFLIVLVAIYNLTIIAFSLLWLFTNSFRVFKNSLTAITELEVNETITYGLFFSGLLGGSFYCLRSLYQRLGDTFTPITQEPDNLAKSLNIKTWFFWYLYRPIQGGVLSLILLSLLNSSLISIKQLTPESLKSYYTLIAIGFLSGFGSHELIQKIQEVIQVVFAKAKIGNTNSESKVKENNNL